MVEEASNSLTQASKHYETTTLWVGEALYYTMCARLSLYWF